ncbi:MAG TPA: hypothetical protein VFR75_06075 [Solirubrobacterales bacterium]|nr:hypothetical protein [Solirubrobacterales bacterium]
MAALAMLAAVGPTSALAATEFGDACVADAAEDNFGLFEISAPGNPLPTAAPTNGVITKWKVNVIPTTEVIPTILKVVRVTDPGVLIVAEASGNVTGGTNAFDARIPVQAGDRLGIYGPSDDIETLYCQTAPEVAHIASFIPGPVGSTNPWEDGNAPIRVPMVGVLEPDVDNDGYGDETQDKCPRSAAIQIPCPVITLDAIGLPGAKSVTVMVATSTAAPVSVSGVVNLGKGKKATLKAAQKTVAAGQLVRFKLKFSSKLTKRLEELKPSKKLTLKITASATDVAGQVSSDQVKAKLKGQS